MEPSENYWTNDVKIFAILNQWRQKYSPPQLTEKTWGQGCVIFGERKIKERNGETKKEEIFWMYNKAIIEFGFRRIWRILQISLLLKYRTKEIILSLKLAENGTLLFLISDFNNFLSLRKLNIVCNSLQFATVYSFYKMWKLWMR